jgi:putative glutamine amidotransferase
MTERADKSGWPVIGITMDIVEANGRLKADCSLAYAACVEKAGGVPIMLPPIVGLIGEHLQLCDGFVFTGGDDPKTEEFGVPTHPQAKPVHPQRQAYELGLLEELRVRRPEVPVLGVCLGMQLMALHAGGRMNQSLPDTLPTHADHKNAEHAVAAVDVAKCAIPLSGVVWSNHRQAVAEPGKLAVLARSADGVVEAIGDPARPWYCGVQWHPERTKSPETGQRVFQELVVAVRR